MHTCAHMSLRRRIFETSPVEAPSPFPVYTQKHRRPGRERTGALSRRKKHNRHSSFPFQPHVHAAQTVFGGNKKGSKFGGRERPQNWAAYLGSVRRRGVGWGTFLGPKYHGTGPPSGKSRCPVYVVRTRCAAACTGSSRTKIGSGSCGTRNRSYVQVAESLSGLCQSLCAAGE
ncbi:hypothetical protein BDY21DRAFT_83008 [Lineolata rhizophorae]|uniref:Uncharacterized protein n=1 Tax=Lineolata rhizophorae TaxID=578093 RepID=A0A6A6PBK1_9PEZI|nr:hypothetical protein BDY21DRAFT_83008 [Lineolata rhizophorae]